MASLKVSQRLEDLGLKFFTSADYGRVFGLSRASTYKALERYAKQKGIVRLRNGLYMLPRAKISPLVIANILYRPSYISYETALSHHHLIPESVYAVTSATTRRTHELEADDHGYIYHSIKRGAFTGYRGYKIGDETVMMAEPEKALCDSLFLVFLKKQELNDRIDWTKVNRKILSRHARLFKPATFSKWVDHVSDR